MLQMMQLFPLKMILKKNLESEGKSFVLFAMCWPTGTDASHGIDLHTLLQKKCIYFSRMKKLLNVSIQPWPKKMRKWGTEQGTQMTCEMESAY